MAMARVHHGSWLMAKAHCGPWDGHGGPSQRGAGHSAPGHGMVVRVLVLGIAAGHGMVMVLRVLVLVVLCPRLSQPLGCCVGCGYGWW